MKDYIENNIKKCDISYRGGSVVINMENLFSQESLDQIYLAGEEATAGAYQNYLGGGIAGRIVPARNFDTDLLTEEDRKKYQEFEIEIVSWFFEVNNGGGDDYMQENYGTLKDNQNRAISAY